LSPKHDGGAAKTTGLARAVAEKVVAVIVKKDSAAIEAMSDLPFIGGAPHNQRLIKPNQKMRRTI
jgi:predicted thioesterase